MWAGVKEIVNHCCQKEGASSVIFFFLHPIEAFTLLATRPFSIAIGFCSTRVHWVSHYVLMACAGHGRTVLQCRGIYRFGVRCLNCLALIINGMCCQDQHWSRSFLLEILILATMLSMVIGTRWVNILQMASILWTIFVKIIPRPKTHKTSHFAMMQDLTTKDVEGAFDVL
jgi:hypothetical protein